MQCLCFTHPFDPRRPLTSPGEHVNSWQKYVPPESGRSGWQSINHQSDYRLTDFLLIRTGSSSNRNPKVRVTLRSLFNGFNSLVTGNAPDLSSSTLYGFPSPELIEALDTISRIGVYTMGQCELLTDIPTPEGKKIAEIKKEWLKVHSLR